MITNQKGSALIWILVVASIIAIIASFLPQFFTSNERKIKINYMRSSIIMVKESVISMLDNDAAWVETLNRNPSMDCIKTAGAVCGSGPHVGIDLYNADGTLYLSQAASSGLTLTGESCNQFDSINGHQTCVLKFILSWECNGPCPPTQFVGVLVADKPSLKLKAELIFSPFNQKDTKLVNAQAPEYTFNFIRGSQLKTLSNFCNSISGIFNQQNQTCAAVNAEPNSFDCTALAGPHAFFIGYNSDGTPKCINNINLGATCPAGTAVVGYQSDGSIACGAF